MFRLPEQEVRDSLLERGITLTGPYLSFNNLTTFKCDKGHKWKTTLGAVYSAKTGCKICQYAQRSRKVDPILIFIDLLRRDITMLGEYKGILDHNTFKHSCGYEWVVSTSQLYYAQTGCPKCAPSTDADVVYLWQVDNSDIFKIGVTSHRLGEQRIRQVAHVNNQTPTIVRLTACDDARIVEQTLLTFGTNPQLDVVDGKTEYRRLTDDELNLAVWLIDMISVLHKQRNQTK